MVNQKDKHDLWNDQIKVKTLQKIGENLGIIIPKKWLNALDWNEDSILTISLDLFENLVIIRKPRKSMQIENTNQPESGNS
jgi:antitoxin component of MazEF toxin-antitoxin module